VDSIGVDVVSVDSDSLGDGDKISDSCLSVFSSIRIFDGI
jgi:hypothetical protein